jgi:hypothetical protein
MSAYLLAAEIAEWDKARTLLAVLRDQPLEGPDDQFMADGMYCYESMLAVLHGESPRSDTRAYRKWTKYSKKHRKEMAKRGLPIDGSRTIDLTAELIATLNRKRPDETYSGPEPMAQLKKDLAESGDPSAQSVAFAGVDRELEDAKDVLRRSREARESQLQFAEKIEEIRADESEPGSLGAQLAELEKKYAAPKDESEPEAP